MTPLYYIKANMKFNKLQIKVRFSIEIFAGKTATNQRRVADIIINHIKEIKLKFGLVKE